MGDKNINSRSLVKEKENNGGYNHRGYSHRYLIYELRMITL